VPTRELGQQIFKNPSHLRLFPEVSIAATCGGIQSNTQIERFGTNSYCGSNTGRLIDFNSAQSINLKKTKFCLRRNR
jgi:superfamily II DNA/RNA helicase